MGRSKTDSASSSVTLERATRLAKLLKLIAKTARPRAELLDRLGIDVRGFYRDLKTLRDRGIGYTAGRDSYKLTDDLDEARDKLPAPDPQLSLAELKALARGNTDAHKKLKKLLAAVVGTAAASNGYFAHR